MGGVRPQAFATGLEGLRIQLSCWGLVSDLLLGLLGFTHLCQEFIGLGWVLWYEQGQILSQGKSIYASATFFGALQMYRGKKALFAACVFGNSASFEDGCYSLTCRGDAGLEG